MCGIVSVSVRTSEGQETNKSLQKFTLAEVMWYAWWWWRRLSSSWSTFLLLFFSVWLCQTNECDVRSIDWRFHPTDMWKRCLGGAWRLSRWLDRLPDRWRYRVFGRKNNFSARNPARAELGVIKVRHSIGHFSKRGSGVVQTTNQEQEDKN